jgi:hypothetical protein
VWYEWTAPSDIDNLDVCVTDTADGSNLLPLVAVYTGSLGSLTEVAYANNDNSICNAILTFNATNGTTYMIGVGVMRARPAGSTCLG